MKVRGLLTDRKKLVEALERDTGLEAIYCGAPSFKYTVGEHTILRDGSLDSTDAELIKRLSEQGLVESIAEDNGISFPTENFSGRSLVNLVNCFAAKEKMLNKAVGQPNAFHMGVGLVRELKKENPATVPEFMDVLFANGGEKTMRGVRVTRSSVSFPGFPDTPTFQTLATLMVRAATTQGWIKSAAKPTENEKYSFRVWLMALGMKGPEYKALRAELLSHFEGDGAFRTEEQRAAFYAKRKKKVEEPDFIVL